MPKISIIVPVYNVEKYLPQCLDSLINQTLKDIEIICVNDGSTDSSLSVLKEYAKKDSRIVIVDKENSGPGTCRNIGIEKATGEFIQFVDSDDWIEPETCEVCYQKAIEHNVDMVSFNAKVLHADKTYTYHYYDSKEEKIVNWENITHLIFRWPFHSWHYLIKKELITINQIKYPENIFWCEDVPFVLCCWFCSKKVCLLPNLLYNYIRRTNSITLVSNRAFDTFYLIPYLNKLLKPYEKQTPLLKKELSRWLGEHLLYSYQKLQSKKDITKFKKLIKKTKCNKEYKSMIKRLKNGNQTSIYIKLFGIFQILSIKKKNQKTKYSLLGLPIFSIKKIGNSTNYIFCKICLLKIIKK